MSEPFTLRPEPVRPEYRRYVAALVIVAATAQVLGITLKAPTHLEVNDISRWCTVWSLLERGTYAIDECPLQSKTQDKVRRQDKLLRAPYFLVIRYYGFCHPAAKANRLRVQLHTGRSVQLGATSPITTSPALVPRCPGCRQPTQRVCTFLLPYRQRGPPSLSLPSSISLSA